MESQIAVQPVHLTELIDLSLLVHACGLPAGLK